MSTEQQPPEYPEAEKWGAAMPDVEVIDTFLDYLAERGIHLAEYALPEGYSRQVLVPVATSRQDLIYGRFGVNPYRLEAERRAMVEAMLVRQETERAAFREEMAERIEETVQAGTQDTVSLGEPEVDVFQVDNEGMIQQ